MNLDPFYLKILKIIKGFVLISFIFSYFYCYGQKRIQKGDNTSSLPGNVVPGEDDNASSSQDYLKSDKNSNVPSLQNHMESNKDNNVPSLQNYLVLDKDNRFFKENVERYFMNGAGESFDARKNASQTFQGECLKERYAAFKTQINNYKQIVFYDEDGNYDPLPGQRLVNAIKQSMRSCGRHIYERYVNLDNEINERVKAIGFDSPDSVLSVLASTASSQLPKRVIDLKIFFEDWRTFRSQCIRLVRARFKHEKEASVKFRESLFSSTLKRMYNNGCTGQRKKFKSSPERTAFNEFLKTPERCRQQSGCVMELRKDMGLENAAQRKHSLFNILSEQTGRTNNCCLVNYECNHVPEARQSYDVILQSVGNSYHKNICRLDSPERKVAFKQFKRKTLEVCRESEEMCSDKVDKILADFRSRFLSCFFLPDFNEQAYKLHVENECKTQIISIKEIFDKAARPFTTKSHPEIMFESLSSPEGGSSGHPFVKKCQEPFDKLQDLLEARASRFLSHICSGQDPNENNQNRAQAAQANSVI